MLRVRDITFLFNEQCKHPIMLLFVASAQTPVAPASVGSPTAHQPIQLSDLQNILATMNVPAAAAAQGSAGETAEGQVLLQH